MSRRWAFLSAKGSSFSIEPSGNGRRFRRSGADEGDALLSWPPSLAGLAAATASADEENDDGDRWSQMLPELLAEIIRRVEASEEQWPLRRSVVACACVCRRWREVTTSIVPSPQVSRKITFPSSLKQPGPQDAPMQCFIKRNKKNSTFYLYLGVAHAFVDKGKFLIAAQRYRSGAHTEYVLCIDADDLSQRSKSYMGKLSYATSSPHMSMFRASKHFFGCLCKLSCLSSSRRKVLVTRIFFRSDFLGTKFTFYDSQPPHDGAKASNSRSCRRFANKQISPQVPAGNFKIGHVSYKFNLLKSRGPRRMHSMMQLSSTTLEADRKLMGQVSVAPLVMKNKTPRWHEHLQCWCLNFHGRVTVASVKNFQLAAVGDEETVLLQFGKVGDDLFTMDYRYPLSAFQAFAICLTSFGTKIACE